MRTAAAYYRRCIEEKTGRRRIEKLTYDPQNKKHDFASFRVRQPEPIKKKYIYINRRVHARISYEDD